MDREEESINNKGLESTSFYLLMRQDIYPFWIHQKEIEMYLMESTSYVECPSAFWASSVLLSIGPMHWAHLMGEKENVVVLLLFAASTHSPASSHTERKSAEPQLDL